MGEIIIIIKIDCERNLLPVLCDFAQRVRAPDELVEGLREIGKGRSVGTFLLPAVEHELVDGLRTFHGRG